ncbi:hypothetical protein ACJBXQ_11395, partial [Streptococcus suis]
VCVFGLDYDENYRNLTYFGLLKDEVYTKYKKVSYYIMNNQPNKRFIKNPFLVILVIATIVTAFQFINAGQQVATQEIRY